MAFVLLADIGSEDDLPLRYKRYFEYLKTIQDKFPEGAYRLATAQWYYEVTDHRSPHDAWLESVLIRENSTGDRNQRRSIDIVVRLLGAYHDGYIELSYRDVKSYELGIAFQTFHPECDNQGHQDWRCDEFRLSKNEFVLHEINWSRGSWLIESCDVAYRWIPRSG